ASDQTPRHITTDSDPTATPIPQEAGGVDGRHATMARDWQGNLAPVHCGGDALSIPERDRDQPDIAARYRVWRVQAMAIQSDTGFVSRPAQWRDRPEVAPGHTVADDYRHLYPGCVHDNDGLWPLQARCTRIQVLLHAGPDRIHV